MTPNAAIDQRGDGAHVVESEAIHLYYRTINDDVYD
jgi:hypothetical protein